MIAFIILVTGIIALTLAFTAGRKKNITVYNRDYNGHKSASDELPERYRMSKGLFIALLLLLLVYLLAKYLSFIARPQRAIFVSITKTLQSYGTIFSL